MYHSSLKLKNNPQVNFFSKTMRYISGKTNKKKKPWALNTRILILQLLAVRTWCQNPTSTRATLPQQHLPSHRCSQHLWRQCLWVPANRLPGHRVSHLSKQALTITHPFPHPFPCLLPRNQRAWLQVCAIKPPYPQERYKRFPVLPSGPGSVWSQTPPWCLSLVLGSELSSEVSVLVSVCPYYISFRVFCKA